MAATNYTPIQLYHSTTASAVPVNTNLVNGELAINITDGKLYYKDNGGTVQVIASKGTGTIGGSTTQVQYNLSGALAGSSNFVFDGTTATINTLNLTNALGATYGGTAQSSWTTGDLLYASGSNTLAKLGIGLNTYILTSNGSIPGWAAPSAISVNTATNLAGGAAGSVPYQSGAGATTFLSIGTANQVIESTGTAPSWVSTSGTGNVARVTSPTFVTPTLGAASATSINKVAITAPASSATLTIADGKTLTANASLTLTGTDSTTMTFPATSTTVAGLGITQTFTGINTFSPTARTSGAAPYFTVTTPADTGLTASTEVIGSSFTAATRTWATGALTLQRERVFAAPTYAFAGASTLTTAVNVDIGLPVAGTNATITNAYALRADNTLFTGNVVLNNASAALDLTNLEVTNIKAKDGTAAMSIADSTGVVSITANPVLSGGTANGVLYLNASKVATSGSALTFDGSQFAVNASSSGIPLVVNGTGNTGLRVVGGTGSGLGAYFSLQSQGANSALIGTESAIAGNTSNNLWLYGYGSNSIVMAPAAAEMARLTSTGLHLGTSFSSISNRLQVAGNAAIGYTTAAPTTGLIVAGNVGIGTDSPNIGGAAKALTINGTDVLLELANSGAVSASLYGSSSGAVLTGVGSVGLRIYTSASGASSERVVIGASGNLILRQSSNAANTSVSFNTTVQNALTLDSSGNLGVGITNPAVKLVVSNGGANGYEFDPANSFISSYNRNTSTWTAVTFRAGAYTWNINNSNDALKLDSSGNLGLGVTPSAGWAATAKVLDFAFPSVGMDTTGATILGFNAYNSSGTTWNYKTTDEAALFTVTTAGAFTWRQAASGTAGNTISFTQAMTLDALGNLLVGATGQLIAGVERFRVDGATPTTSSGAYPGTMVVSDSRAYNSSSPPAGGGISFAYKYTSGGAYAVGPSIQGFKENTTDGNYAGGLRFLARANGSNPAEAARITSDGIFVVGPSGAPTGSEGTATRTLVVAGGGYNENNVGAINITGGTGNNNTPSGYSLRAIASGTNNGLVNDLAFATTSYTGSVSAVSEKARLTSAGNLKIGGTADRSTTGGTAQLVLFNGTAPVGTLANGISIYSSSGEAYVMDSAGNATLFSPHDAETNEWIFKSKHTPTGRVLKIDVEKLLRFINDQFGLDAVHEFIEE